jgi:two-component system, NtrC family, nitrogen regulation response regulator NtrX
MSATHTMRATLVRCVVACVLAWIPGNVRELQNVLERAVIMSGERISALDLPAEIVAAEDAAHQSAGSALEDHRDRAERDFILATLRKNKGNISQAALDLGVRRTYLHRRLVALKISKKDFFT